MAAVCGVKISENKQSASAASAAAINRWRNRGIDDENNQ
jgi:hypothetical protein